MSSPKTPKSKNRDLSSYEKFRIEKLYNKDDDEASSVHFSHPRDNFTDRIENNMSDITKFGK